MTSHTLEDVKRSLMKPEVLQMARVVTQRNFLQTLLRDTQQLAHLRITHHQSRDPQLTSQASLVTPK